MISEALELYVEGGLVSHSWCVSVVGHGYGGLGAGRDGCGGWYACGTKSGGLVTCRECWSTSRVRGDDVRCCLRHVIIKILKRLVVSH